MEEKHKEEVTHLTGQVKQLKKDKKNMQEELDSYQQDVEELKDQVNSFEQDKLRQQEEEQKRKEMQIAFAKETMPNSVFNKLMTDSGKEEVIDNKQLWFDMRNEKDVQLMKVG